MRDKNQSYQQFNIQLSETLERESKTFLRFLRDRVVVTPTLLEDFYFRYPSSYRLLRSLCIFQWYLPEEFHYRIWLDLTDMNFSHLNSKQRIELNLILESKDVCCKYLYETNRYSGHEIFGNILRNDIRDLKKILKLRFRCQKVKKTQRRRGYNDHGSRKPREKWLPDSDVSFTEYQLSKEKKQNLEFKTIQRLSEILRNL